MADYRGVYRENESEIDEYGKLEMACILTIQGGAGFEFKGTNNREKAFPNPKRETFTVSIEGSYKERIDTGDRRVLEFTPTKVESQGQEKLVEPPFEATFQDRKIHFRSELHCFKSVLWPGVFGR